MIHLNNFTNLKNEYKNLINKTSEMSTYKQLMLIETKSILNNLEMYIELNKESIKDIVLQLGEYIEKNGYDTNCKKFIEEINSRSKELQNLCEETTDFEELYNKIYNLTEGDINE